MRQSTYLALGVLSAMMLSFTAQAYTDYNSYPTPSDTYVVVPSNQDPSGNGTMHAYPSRSTTYTTRYDSTHRYYDTSPRTYNDGEARYYNTSTYNRTRSMLSNQGTAYTSGMNRTGSMEPSPTGNGSTAPNSLER